MIGNKMLLAAAGCAAMVAAMPGVASAQDKNDLAAKFGARPSVEQISLSPDGSRIAYLSPAKGQGTIVYVVPLDGSSQGQVALYAAGDPDRLSNCKWAASTRLVCTLFGVTQLSVGELANYSRVVAVDDDGKNIKVVEKRGREKLGYDLFGGSVIDWLPDEDGNVLMTRRFIPEVSIGTRLAEEKDGLGVIRLNTRSLVATTVERPTESASEYISDGRGTIRIRAFEDMNNGYQTGSRTYMFRTKGSDSWKRLSQISKEGEGFDPYGVYPDLDVAYGLKKVNGRLAAYQMKLDGSQAETELLAHPEVDVDGFVRIGRRARIVGASFATDHRQVKYFDLTLERLSRSLAKAIPDTPLVHFVDSSTDENKLLILAASDVNPGRYYVLDRTTKQMNEVMLVRPELDGVALSPVKPVSYRAADGTNVPGYLTLPPGRTEAKGLPGIVMPHGGPGARDEWGFDWLAQYYAASGFAVLQPNFRGSAGYGDAWFMENGFQNWETAIGDVNDGGRWLVSQGVDPSKLAILGWSYGGYAALQSGVAEPDLFKAIVAVAPVTDLTLLKDEWRGWSNYRVQRDFIGSGPHVAEGSPARNASKIKAPVLMFHGMLDRNVGIGQSRKMQSSLSEAGKKSELVVYDKLDHQLEDSAARAELLRKSDAFIRKALGI